ncbi:Lipoprotein spr precursor [Chitinispirillum alkaliphilum]|nr:Lipoprotein spr precursor [Chitinispirillum alkaliphilum]
MTSSVRYTRKASQPNREKSSPNRIVSPQSSRFRRIVESYLGVPYRYGGKTRRGIDCSGLVSAVFKDAFGLEFQYSSSKMREVTTSIPAYRARVGDLVFFRGDNSGRINHVGIYMGNGRFVHASSSNGVIYSELSQEYYRNRFAGYGRVNQ